jgi:hypothetical protein
MTARRGAILVVEGISAAGKTSWCARHAAGHVVPETPHGLAAPDRASDPEGAGAFWAERNVLRWEAAVTLANRSGLAVCDTDPLKLHYVWTLWRIGAATEADWRAECAATRATVAASRIGFADAYLVATTGPDVALAQATADPSRRRSRIALHVRLHGPLMDWYRALDAAAPGRVSFELPDALPALAPRTDPDGDLAIFDRLVAALPA